MGREVSHKQSDAVSAMIRPLSDWPLVSPPSAKKSS